jgi:hypothetical protein
VGLACDEFAAVVAEAGGAEAAREAFLASLSPEMVATVGKACPVCGLFNVHFRGHG